jgi:hypothetical protein
MEHEPQSNWLVVELTGIVALMSQPLTANDLLPLVARLAPLERLRLARLIEATAERDAAVYLASPPGQDEFSNGDEPLAWDSEGWDAVS